MLCVLGGSVAARLLVHPHHMHSAAPVAANAVRLLSAPPLRRLLVRSFCTGRGVGHTSTTTRTRSSTNTSAEATASTRLSPQALMGAYVKVCASLSFGMPRGE